MAKKQKKTISKDWKCTMSNKNEITGDSIVNNKGSSKKYADGWEAIFGKGKRKVKEQPDSGSDGKKEK